MKYLLILLLSLSLSAKTYTISGGKNNVTQIIASKILEVAYFRAGLDMNTSFIQLEESLLSSNSGKTDGEIARIKKISLIYTNLVIVPVALTSVEAIAFSKKDITIKTWDDLKAYDFSIVKGAKFIEIATKKMDKKFVLSFEQAFIDLKNDKTQVIVLPKLAGLKYMYSQEFYDIKPVSSSLKTLKLYHFVNKKNIHLIPLLTPILKSMLESGEIRYWRDSHLRSISIISN